MAKNDIWITRTGKKIKMCDMTDSHLKNAINYFKPDKEGSKKRWKLLMAEKRRRGKKEEDKTDDGPITSRFDILDI